MSRFAIVDIPKSGGNPVLNLPSGAHVKKSGSVVRISFRGKQVWFHILKQTPTRWIAFVSAPKRAFSWLSNHLGADCSELTHEFWQANKAQLASIGLVGETMDGAEVLRVPHTIAGASAFIGAGD